MRHGLAAFIISLVTFSTLTMANTESQYKQTTLPDGSTQMTYSDSEGNKMTQIHKPDGTVETHAIDQEGNETISTTHPNGDTETKTKSKKS